MTAQVIDGRARARALGHDLARGTAARLAARPATGTGLTARVPEVLS